MPHGRAPEVERLERGPEGELRRVRRREVPPDLGGHLGGAAALGDDDDGREEARDVDRSEDDLVEEHLRGDERGRAAREARRDEGVEPAVPGVAQGPDDGGAVEGRGREVARGGGQRARVAGALLSSGACCSASPCLARGGRFASAGRGGGVGS